MFENAERALEQVVEAIQVPRTRYDAANRAFLSICQWLAREKSGLAQFDPSTSLQGSFRLGTAIKPLTDDDEYDVDIVCTLDGLTKARLAPVELKKMVGVELKEYAKSKGMTRPNDGRRCWTQPYADEAQFHVDILPSLPDPTRQRELLETYGAATDWAETAIAITDKTDVNYEVINDRWPLSNPTAYAIWFESRMSAVLRKRKEAIALTEHASVDSIPTYRARTPLQSAIQLLKYHRDVMFAEDSENKPISIIITTLSARAYQGETTLLAALIRIIADMDTYIEQKNAIDWVVNPTNSLENFADKWIEYPKRRQNFHDWLRTVRNDLERLRGAADSNARRMLVEETFGAELAGRVAEGQGSTLKKLLETAKLKLLSAASHRKLPPWTGSIEGHVQIYRAIWSRDGFRPNPFSSDGPALRKHADIKFLARTDVEPPFEVYWQVVNTGTEAEGVIGGLRGGFDKGEVSRGRLEKREKTLYTGTHSIECFIVKNGYLVARSGQFIVNIR